MSDLTRDIAETIARHKAGPWWSAYRPASCEDMVRRAMPAAVKVEQQAREHFAALLPDLIADAIHGVTPFIGSAREANAVELMANEWRSEPGMVILARVEGTEAP